MGALVTSGFDNILIFALLLLPPAQPAYFKRKISTGFGDGKTLALTSAVTVFLSLRVLQKKILPFLPRRFSVPFLPSQRRKRVSLSFGKIFQSTEHQLRVFVLEREKVFVLVPRPFSLSLSHSFASESKDMRHVLSHKSDINGYTQHHANGSIQ